MTATEETEWLALMVLEAKPPQEAEADKIERMKAVLLSAAGTR